MAVIGRPREFDRDAALEAAMLVFWRKGFAATSMNDLCDAMGVRSPSLYAAFGSKEALYLEAIDHYVRTVGPPVWDELEDGETARAGVQNLLSQGPRACRIRTSPAGCMATAGGGQRRMAGHNRRCRQEGPARNAGHAAVAAGNRIGQRRTAATTDIDGLSRFYLGVVQGMAVQARDGATSASWEPSRERQWLLGRACGRMLLLCSLCSLFAAEEAGGS